MIVYFKIKEYDALEKIYTYSAQNKLREFIGFYGINVEEQEFLVDFFKARGINGSQIKTSISAVGTVMTAGYYHILEIKISQDDKDWFDMLVINGIRV
jgi:hypothetical protein